MELLRNEKVAVNTVEIEFKITAEEFGDAITKAFRRGSKEITVPGFRKGKAPRSVIEKMYGAEIFYEDALNEVLPQAYEDAVKESGAVVVSQPELDVVSMSKEDGVVVKATLTVYPEITLGEYKGLKAERRPIEVSEEVIAAELAQLQDRNARFVSTDDRPARMGDTTNIDFEGFMDGVAFEGGKGEGYDIELGSGMFIPGFEDQIVGHNVGDEFDVNVTFPEGYQAEELRGKPAVFKTKLNEIKVKEVPALDDEFAKDVSEFDTLKELEEDIRTKKIREAKDAAELQVENDLVDQIVNGMAAEIPDSMYDVRAEEMVSDYDARLQQQGLSLETYLGFINMTRDEFKKSFLDQAEKQVKIRLALEKVAELENIAATDEEFEAEVLRIATTYNYPMDKLKTDDIAPEIRKDLAIQKAIDFIKENAEITDAPRAVPAE
jgi:trigger factor